MLKVTTSYWCNYVHSRVPSRGPRVTTGWETWHDNTCYVDRCLRQILDTRPTRRFEHSALYFSLSWSLFWQIFVSSRIRWPIFPAFVSNVKIQIPSRVVWRWLARLVYFVWGDRFESQLGHRLSWLKFFCGFSQSFQACSLVVPRFGHGRFDQNQFIFAIQWASYYRRLCLESLQLRKINHETNVQREGF